MKKFFSIFWQGHHTLFRVSRAALCTMRMLASVAVSSRSATSSGIMTAIIASCLFGAVQARMLSVNATLCFKLVACSVFCGFSVTALAKLSNMGCASCKTPVEQGRDHAMRMPVMLRRWQTNGKLHGKKQTSVTSSGPAAELQSRPTICAALVWVVGSCAKLMAFSKVLAQSAPSVSLCRSDCAGHEKGREVGGISCQASRMCDQACSIEKKKPPPLDFFLQPTNFAHLRAGL